MKNDSNILNFNLKSERSLKILISLILVSCIIISIGGLYEYNQLTDWRKTAFHYGMDYSTPENYISDYREKFCTPDSDFLKYSSCQVNSELYDVYCDLGLKTKNIDVSCNFWIDEQVSGKKITAQEATERYGFPACYWKIEGECVV